MARAAERATSSGSAGSGSDTIARDTDPPQCLWLRGPLPLDEACERSVAIVGSRASTAYGAHVAAQLAYGLVERGWTVVSGGAFGIDAAAHRAALAADGRTVAVLACGIDRAYPVTHTALFQRIGEHGLLLTEWPPGADPHRRRFLIRNRVIAALTRGTVLVEAGRSGPVHAGGRARALNRLVMAVPGPVTSAMSVGSHEELRTGGTILVADADHVIDAVGSIGTDLAPVRRAGVCAGRALRRGDPGAGRLPRPRRSESRSGWPRSPGATSSRCCGFCPRWNWPTWCEWTGTGWRMAPRRKGGLRRGVDQEVMLTCRASCADSGNGDAGCIGHAALALESSARAQSRWSAAGEQKRSSATRTKGPGPRKALKEKRALLSRPQGVKELEMRRLLMFLSVAALALVDDVLSQSRTGRRSQRPYQRDRTHRRSPTPSPCRPHSPVRASGVLGVRPELDSANRPPGCLGTRMNLVG